MDFWKSPQKQKGWDYIKTIDPDICLLNECSNPNLFLNYIHNEQTNGWGCGVFSKHKLDEIIIDKCHPGAIAICETNINSINIMLSIMFIIYIIQKLYVTIIKL